MASLDAIKRQARKEAWYSDSWNPFGKTMRSSTWSSNPHQSDVEARGGISGEPIHTVQTEPTHSRGISDDTDDTYQRRSKDNEFEMTAGNGSGSGSGSHGKEREADSEETAVDRQSTRPPSQEEKARRRFVSKFWKKGDKGRNTNSSDETEKPKKQPWYKGKELKHKPFTVKNQLQHTIFNSWINILLLAAPVGIALNFGIGTEGTSGIIVFVVNFIAIIPLAGMLSFATEEVALHLGESLGGLLNASFG